MVKKRIEYLDIAKAIGIAFVLLGHTGIPEKLRAIVYSFHMPLFFVISGIWFKRQEYCLALKKSSIHCLCPYISFSLIFAVLNLLVLHDSNLFVKNIQDILWGRGTCNVLWFLFSLFLVENIYQIVIHHTTKPLETTLLLMTFSLILRILGVPNYWFILSSMEALFFFSLGNTMLKPEKVRCLFSTKTFICLLIGDMVLFSVCDAIYPCRLDLSDAVLGVFPISLFIAVCGILMIFMLSECISQYTKYIKIPLLYIGEHSLYFFTLTAFLPGLAEELLSGIGINTASAITKLILKILSFVIVYIVISLKTAVDRRVHSSIKKGATIE